MIIILAPEYYANLTSPPPVKVSQYPEDKHGGYSDSVATLLQHTCNLIAINNLKQSMPATLLHIQTITGYSYSIWSGWITGPWGGEGWIVSLASSHSQLFSVQLLLKSWKWA